ncbi:MAG TPA: hypothetical protein VLE97_11690 [Gaiellaceae bacterium]|nr:hypothetical protein [Gaiellaceae bacterium]
MSRIRYLKITQTDGTRFILRVTRESPHLVSGIEVDAEGDEVVPRGLDPVTGQPWHQRERHVPRGAIRKAVEMRMSPTYATLEVVPREASAKKTSAQLDAEIAEILGRERESHAAIAKKSRASQGPQLRPVEGIRIPPESRRALTKFWRAHPALRKGCVAKYGFDPIDEEAAYWRFGLAEPDHRDVLRSVRRNNNVFSAAHVKRWEIQELRDA